LRLNPDIDILRVGDIGAPPLGTLDPDVLLYLESVQRLLITDNRRSMPGHLRDHWETGHQIWGLFWIRPETSIFRLAEELVMLWEISEAEEWCDILDWLPL
jgi:hypothetical protein